MDYAFDLLKALEIPWNVSSMKSGLKEAALAEVLPNRCYLAIFTACPQA